MVDAPDTHRWRVCLPCEAATPAVQPRTLTSDVPLRRACTVLVQWLRRACTVLVQRLATLQSPLCVHARAYPLEYVPSRTCRHARTHARTHTHTYTHTRRSSSRTWQTCSRTGCSTWCCPEGGCGTPEGGCGTPEGGVPRAAAPRARVGARATGARARLQHPGPVAAQMRP